jgi:type III secretion system YscQ/HrcQ family protein
MFSPVKLTRAEAAAGNALCHLAAVAARTFGTEVTFSSAAASEEMVELTLALNGVETPMFVSPGAIHRAARSFFDLAKDSQIPEGLVAATLEASLAPLIERLEKAAGVEIAVRSMKVAEQGAPASALAFRLPGLPDGGVVAVRPAAKLALPTLPAVPWTTGDGLVLRVPIVVAEVGVSVAELEHLSDGDVIVLPGMTAANVADVHLAISPRTAIIAKIDGHKLTVARAGKSMSNTDAASGAKPAAAARPAAPAAKPGAAPAAAAAAPAPVEPVLPPAAVEDLPLRIVFDLGDVELSIAELKALVPGQVIDLAREPGNAVRVSVNGRRIGAGEIVEIEGRLGVRITELAVRNERPAS